MEQAQPSRTFSIKEIAQDIFDADPLVEISQIVTILNRSEIWFYEWGAIFADGQEMHIHVMTDYRKRVYLKKPLREVAQVMFKKYNTLTTIILKKKEVLDFDLRIGWKLVNESEFVYHLEMRKDDFAYA